MNKTVLMEIGGSYNGIQLLRFVAALAVLMAHISLACREQLGFLQYPIFDFGLAGVAIFFAISGFVMIVSTSRLVGVSKSWQDFAIRRILRIVPIYWIATTMKLLIVLLLPSLAIHSAFDPFHTIASYLFIPARDEVGNISPLHAVGWTLNYEMFFYLLFTVALFVKRSPMLLVGSLLICLVICGLFFDENRSFGVVAYLQPIVLQFLLGMIVGYLCLRGLTPKAYISFCMVVVGFLAVVMIKTPVVTLGWVSFFFVGIPSALIVAGVAFLEPYLHRWIPESLKELGDSSYSLYLFHPFILATVAIVILRINLNSPILVTLTLIMSSVFGGWVIYKVIELPMMVFFRRLASPFLLKRKSSFEICNESIPLR